MDTNFQGPGALKISISSAVQTCEIDIRAYLPPRDNGYCGHLSRRLHK
jgi:hypothetical protein